MACVAFAIGLGLAAPRPASALWVATDAFAEVDPDDPSLINFEITFSGVPDFTPLGNVPQRNELQIRPLDWLAPPVIVWSRPGAPDTLNVVDFVGPPTFYGPTVDTIVPEWEGSILRFSAPASLLELADGDLYSVLTYDFESTGQILVIQFARVGTRGFGATQEPGNPLVPEPGSVALAGMGLAGVGAVVAIRRTRRGKGGIS